MKAVSVRAVRGWLNRRYTRREFGTCGFPEWRHEYRVWVRDAWAARIAAKERGLDFPTLCEIARRNSFQIL